MTLTKKTNCRKLS